MKLRDWLRQVGLTQAEYGADVGKSQQAIARYCDDRIPPRETIVRIYLDSRGAVTPNDFYDLPELIAVNDNATPQVACEQHRAAENQAPRV